MDKEKNIQKVAAIVVTYNRKELLCECLTALYNQTYPLKKIILIDNASTDGTYEYLKTKNLLNSSLLTYHRMDTNTGGAGGFYEGMRLSQDLELDWVWIMDDDTIPYDNSLEKLVESYHDINEDVSFLASSVFGPEGEYMNVPNISEHKSANGYKDWYKKLKHSAVQIADATFVSLLIKSKAIKNVGLPCKDYFIWGDDTEYTMRLIKNYGPAYLSGKSSVCHKRFGAKSLSIKDEENANRIDMYKYFYRNNLINKKLYLGNTNFNKFYLGAILTSIKCLGTSYGFKKFKSIHKGILSYHREKNKFKLYIQSELNQNKDR